MELAKRILDVIVNLPEEVQKEVLEFIELKKKRGKETGQEFCVSNL
ncbi:hypothetical protein [Caldicellulosiruptor owensensis]|nr:hypothetical protein [Caldicellulosiruptor owensensis]